jgi:hypothetical protein
VARLLAPLLDRPLAVTFRALGPVTPREVVPAAEELRAREPERDRRVGNRLRATTYCGRFVATATCTLCGKKRCAHRLRCHDPVCAPCAVGFARDLEELVAPEPVERWTAAVLSFPTKAKAQRWRARIRRETGTAPLVIYVAQPGGGWHVYATARDRSPAAAYLESGGAPLERHASLGADEVRRFVARAALARWVACCEALATGDLDLFVRIHGLHFAARGGELALPTKAAIRAARKAAAAEARKDDPEACPCPDEVPCDWSIADSTRDPDAPPLLTGLAHPPTLTQLCAWAEGGESRGNLRYRGRIGRRLVARE